MTIRLAAAVIAAALALPACSVADPARPVQQIETGKNFTLSVGAAAIARDTALQIGFEAVTGDSRCPKGEQCVWAGAASVRIWVQQGTGAKQTRELRTAPGAAQAVRLQDHELRLVSLEPYPVSGKPIVPSSYVATFVLRRGGNTDPDQ